MERRNDPVYYICNEDNEQLIKFTLFCLPRDFCITSAEILRPDLVPELFLKYDTGETVFLYLHGCLRDHGVTGYLLDDFIIKRLKLSDKVRNFGRLAGMEYLIDLLEYHFYNEDYHLYVTCESPHTISFFWKVPGWDRILVDVPYSFKKQQLLEQCHRSPDYTINDGLDKFWFYENGAAYLAKSGYIPGIIYEPILAANEVAASRIGRQLGISCVEYTKVMVYDEPFCICRCFSQRNEDIVSARSIAYQLGTDDTRSVRQYFIDYGFQKDLDQMAVFHVLIHNQDAHLNNFALGMDADTGRYTRFIPLYDNGNSLGWNGISRATSKDMKPFESDPREYLNQVQTYVQLPELSVLESIIRDVYQDFQISEAQTQIALDTIREGFEMVSDRMQQLQQELEPEEVGSEEIR